MRTTAAIACLGAALGLPASAGAIVMNSPTTSWTTVGWASPVPDPSNDTKTGQPESDIVGNSANPFFYIAFDGAGTPSQTDGTLAFRVRLGEDTSLDGFGHSLLVGIDGNLDGTVDIFALVDNTGGGGSGGSISVFNANGGSNPTNSPATTSVQGGHGGVSYSETSANYDWSAVTVVIDPSVTNTNLNGGGTDYFLSFAVAFQDVVNRLAAQGITGVTQNTQVRYVVATSTNGTSINQDLAGPDATGIGSTVTFTALNAMSNPTIVPEPGTGLLLGFGLLGFAVLGRPPVHRRRPR